MSKPVPEKIEASEVNARALALVRSVRFPTLATIDGDQPRVRPVSPVRTDGFVTYIANLKSYHKTVEIEKNSRVELCYVDADHNQVRITGNAEILTDRNVINDIWNSNKLLQHYLGSVDNPQLLIYTITPSRVRYMVEWALEYHEVAI